MEQLQFLWEAIKWIAVWFVISAVACYGICSIVIFVRATHCYLYKHFLPYTFLIDMCEDVKG